MRKNWVTKVGIFVLLFPIFQNCGRKLETGNTSSETNQTTTSAPEAPAERYPIPQPSPAAENQPNSQLPAPNPMPTPNPQDVQNPTPTVDGDTNIQIAAQYPADTHFTSVKWGGVFDPRVMGTAQYSPASWTDVTTYGQGRCITSDMLVTAADGSKYVTLFWYFTNNQFNANEALLPLRINSGENVAYKVILPPGTSESTAGDQSSLWGNVWTQSTPRNSAPTYANGQSYGGFNPLVSYPVKNGFTVNPSFLITQPLTQETYGVLWFQHRGEGDNSVIAVKEFTVNIKVKDVNLYNQWLSRTTGISCP